MSIRKIMEKDRADGRKFFGSNQVTPDTKTLFSCVKIRSASGTGSAFFLRNGNNAYLVTARHVVGQTKAGDQLHVKQRTGWLSDKILECKFCEKGSDLAVILLDWFSKTPNFIHPSDEILISENVSYLGFPFNLESKDLELAPGMSELPLPTVKTGHVSKLSVETGMYSNEKKSPHFYVETLNNAGFSGGPILNNISGGLPGERPRLRVIGVVSGYIFDQPIPVLTKNERGEFIESPTHFVKPNSGFMRAVSISNAIDIIDPE